MTTDTHDTAAALEAAIGAIAPGEDAPWSPVRANLHRAITAHVEAEVARRLAPNLELWRWKCHDETIEQAIERLVRERNEYAEKLCERNAALVMAPDVEAAIAKYGVQAAGGADTTAAETALRAAIAADKARAVEAEATRRDAEIFGLRARLAIVAEIADEAISSASEAPDCHEQVQDYRERMRKWRMSKPAHPTPDEARRLVNILVGTVIGDQMDSTPASRAAAKEAVADVLRALGVEA